MPSASISGLASGLDTATIINQLMQLEAIPQNRLESRMATEESAVSKLQDLNKLVAALAGQAEKLAAQDAWAPLKGTSSIDGVTVTATTGASGGNYTVTVNQLAVAHRLTAGSTHAMDDVVTSGGATTVELTIGGVTKALDTGDGTLKGLIDALNAPGTGVRATTINLGNGSHRLRVEAIETGVDTSFTLKNTDGTDVFASATVTAGQDASITIGMDTVTSTTNTFSDVIDGVEFTLTGGVGAGDSFDLSVTRDSEGLTESVRALVDKVNEALSEIDRLTAYDSVSNTAGPLSGDATLRSIRSELINTIYASDNTSLSTVGVELDRNGRLVFDEAVFAEAYAADPEGVAAKLGSGPVGGLAARIQTVSVAASDAYEGSLTNTIKGREQTIDRLADSIADWDYRLDLRRQTLTRQFTALETAMSQMQSQGQWLAGQIASLPSAPAL